MGLGADLYLQRSWQRYMAAILFVGLAAALRIWPLQMLGSDVAWLTFYPAVMLAAVVGGTSAGLLATGLTCLTVLFGWQLLVPTPFIEHHADWLGMAVFSLVGIGISAFGEAMRRANAHARQAMAQTESANQALRQAVAFSQQSEQFLKSITDAMPGLVGYWDSNLRCRFANQPYLEWFGKPPVEVIGMQMQALLGERLFEMNEPYIHGALAGLPQQFERTLTKADGSVGYTLANYIPDPGPDGNIRGFYVLVSDVTSLKRTEAELSLVSKRHELLLRHAGQGIYGLDLEGRITFANTAAETLLGYSEAELIGRRMHELTHHHRRDGSLYPSTECPVHATLNDGMSRQIDDEVFWHADGTPLEVEYKVAVLREAGYVSGAVILFSDITQRRRDERTLARWHDIFKNAEWGVVIGSADGRTMELLNPAFARMHGWAVDELTGQPILDVFAPQSRGEVLENIRLAHTKGHHVWESLHQRKDGSIFPVRVDVTAVKDAAGAVRYRVVNVQDISEERAREEALRRSETTQRLMLEHLPVGIWLADAQGHIVYGNPAGQAIWQGAAYVPPEQFGVYEGWWADSGIKLEARDWALSRAIEKGETSLNEVIDIRCFDGSRRTILNSALPLFDQDGHFEGAVVINQDITEARRAELALREREIALAQAQAQAHLGSWRLDIPNNLLEWSDENYRIFGRPIGSPLTYDTFVDCVHPEDRTYVDQAWHAGMRGESYDIQHRLLVDGRVRWVRERAELEFFPDGRLWRGVGTTQDITELKLKEEELLRSRQLLRELAAHLEQIREEERAHISREIHDELGQYLTALRMDAALLRIRFGKDVPALEQHVATMTQTIDTTIFVVRNVAADLRPAALDMGLVSAAEWLLAGFEERTGIACQLDTPQEDLGLDDARATAAFRILQESLTNITRHAQASLVRVSLHSNDSHFRMRIEDDGVGFDPREVRERKTFGLMGIRERALMFGGESHIDSRPGSGTTLSISLPLHEEPQ